MTTPRVSEFEWWMTGLMSGSLVGGGIAILITTNGSALLGTALGIIGILGFISIYYSRATR